MPRPSAITTDARGNWRVVSRLFPYIWQYKYRIIAALFFLVLSRVANVSVPVALKSIVDQLGGGTNALIIVPMSLLIAYGLLRFSSTLFTELRNLIFSRAGVEIIHQISMQVFAHLHRLSLSFHLDRKTGGLSRDIERGNMAITSFLRLAVFNVLPVFLEIGLVLIILWRQLDIRFVVVTVIMIVVYSIYTFSITRWRTKFRVAMNFSDSLANTRMLDSLLNFETVKTFANESLELQRYDQSLRGWIKASLKNNVSLSALNVGQGLIIVIGVTVMMIMAAQGVQDESLTIGDFVMINAFLIQLYIPLSFLGSVYRDVNHSLIDMEKLFDLMDEKPEVIELPDAKPLEFSNGHVEFKNISFSYQSDHPLLKDINFSIPGGGMVAVVGPSGSGKSTLSRLLLRFIDPDQGTILIDGQNLRDLSLSSLRKVMGVVPQDTVLFNDSVGYNIAYGQPDVDQEKIVEAAKIAQIHDFIEQHPQGYDILVGERGLKLSGGEKQRVAIARVALKKARLLIFDEATSSLDSRSEQAIQQALDNVSSGTTTLVIAHRLSTIISADEILVLDKGQIVERGTHHELVSLGGLYTQMWTLQQDSS